MICVMCKTAADYQTQAALPNSVLWPVAESFHNKCLGCDCQHLPAGSTINAQIEKTNTN